MHRIFRALVLLLPALFLFAPQAFAAGEEPPVTDLLTDVGLLGLNVTNLGYIGHAWSKPYFPSCQYPLYSNTEHIYRGGLWVGARTSDGKVHVSTGAQDANGLEEGDQMREFTNDTDRPIRRLSNNQNSELYHPDALAMQHFEVYFNDKTTTETGNHFQMGVDVTMKTLAWSSPAADDFVVLDYTIKNISGTELSDVYLGFWCDTTVGNTTVTDPWDDSGDNPWVYVDDYNGAWGAAGYGLPERCTPVNDPNIWMTYERDDDGELGLATSWVGIRLLGTEPDPEPEPGTRPVSYNQWRFRQVPYRDDWYYDSGDSTQLLVGKYQVMSNGEFDVGTGRDPNTGQPVNYDVSNNWVSLLSTGPYSYWAPEEELRVTFAVVCGPDSLGLLENSQVAQVAYDEGFALPSGPPSPQLEFAYDDNSIIIRWEPGTDVDPVTNEPLPTDSGLRSPEYHINESSGRPDFQGYRIYRYEGESFTGEPKEQSLLLAEFDKIDGRGFDTGLPELRADGRREFIDTTLKEGHAYWYSVISFSLRDEVTGQDAYESGFNENSELVYPGPAPASATNPQKIGVYPNPYRVTSDFESGSQLEKNRTLWFTGLPARCRIQVFNLAGELVKTLHHDDPVDGKHEWNILSEPVRAIASGLYIYVVEDLATGEIQRGKLVIIK